MIRAVDVGYGRVKGLSEKRAVDFPSVVGNFRPVRFSSGMERQDIIKRLCIDYAGKQYFVGDIAYQQSQARVTMSADRFTSDEGLALTYTALSLLATHTEEAINLVVGLPVNEFASKQDDLKQHLTGRHYIRQISPDGQSYQAFTFHVNDIKILPQPVGTIFNAVLDDSGNLKDKTLAAGKIGVLDIGRNTVDMALTDALSFVDRQSISFDDIGLDDAYRELSLELKKTMNINIPPESLEPYLQNSSIEYRGKARSIENEKRQIFTAQADKITSRVMNVWKDFWQLNKVIITGGGSIVLGDYIAKSLNSPDQVEVYRNNAVFSNVDGYMKFGKRAWK